MEIIPRNEGRQAVKTISALLLVGSFLGAVACGSASTPPATSPPTPTVRVYVTNEASGNLTVIDASTQSVIATAPLGKRPLGIVVSPDKKSLYVALSGSPNARPRVDRKTLPPPDRSADGIGEVDADTYKIKRIIRTGSDPEHLAVSSDGKRLYVTNEDASRLSVVDAHSGEIVAMVKVGEGPEGVAVRPDDKVVYMTSEADGAVFAIDTATHKLLKRLEVGHRPRAIGFLPDGSRAYVTLENDAATAVVDSMNHEFSRLIQLEGQGNGPKPRPMGIAVQPDGSAIYVTAGSFGSLFVIDPANDRTVASMPVGQRPCGVALMPCGRTAYTANGPSNDVSLVDLQARKVIKAGDRPWGVAIVTP